MALAGCWAGSSTFPPWSTEQFGCVCWKHHGEKSLKAPELPQILILVQIPPAIFPYCHKYDVSVYHFLGFSLSCCRGHPHGAFVLPSIDPRPSHKRTLAEVWFTDGEHAGRVFHGVTWSCLVVA